MNLMNDDEKNDRINAFKKEMRDLLEKYDAWISYEENDLILDGERVVNFGTYRDNETLTTGTELCPGDLTVDGYEEK